MCGIAGIVGHHPDNLQNLRSMLEIQKHRGPDATASWIGDSLVLGHNRLSIIDLSEAANQPMHSACGRYVIVFNGEIYNYIELRRQLPESGFRTDSDTEVLLEAYKRWGSSVLDKLNGMFSFVIWDKTDKKLFAARDRFGVKPFYYAFKDGRFYFSSEVKTLFAGGIAKRKSYKVWANYFAFGTYGLPDETFWEGIRQLPAGHFIATDMLTLEQAKPVKWYDFATRISAVSDSPGNDFKERYEAMLHDAISLRFRADVPLGMNVSGGLDSSLLISMVHQNLSSDKNIEAFTFYSGDARYDELPWVSTLMEQTPYPLNKVLLQWQDIPKMISEISYCEDEPFGGFPTLAYSLLFKEARARKIPVILDGQGMDEAWAGYDYYHNRSDSVIQGVTSSPVRPEIMTPDFAAFAEKEFYPEPFDSRLQNLQFRDLFFTKMPRALRFNDRISMKYGIELREPFLDYRLVETAFAQTDAMKLQNGQTKWLLRDIARKHLGDSIALAPKRAVQTPQREWISNELKSYFDERIDAFSKTEGVDPNAVKRIWAAYCEGNQDNSFYIWQWINAVAVQDNR
ncbi:asparagine synthase (glutamine-hydrolyzing) [Flavobacterium magnum]|uniref:asparagine synthase (glutamine-hydrolyzing) n=1 Tax=Flavobacterium magnum TaxID=2162713 RepID=A0A2S0RGE3_9FLAO|nr:asparagine synthase (glutamine-hydrolyzing) [Flavobacterium magnum]AWA29782.1 asparagine synthase (glutamine-hydrolyzing) [Flavobacterium magnum]